MSLTYRAYAKYNPVNNAGQHGPCVYVKGPESCTNFKCGRTSGHSALPMTRSRPFRLCSRYRIRPESRSRQGPSVLISDIPDPNGPPHPGKCHALGPLRERRRKSFGKKFDP
jgi:hypothetical protein